MQYYTKCRPQRSTACPSTVLSSHMAIGAHSPYVQHHLHRNLGRPQVKLTSLIWGSKVPEKVVLVRMVPRYCAPSNCSNYINNTKSITNIKRVRKASLLQRTIEISSHHPILKLNNNTNIRETKTSVMFCKNMNMQWK